MVLEGSATAREESALVPEESVLAGVAWTPEPRLQRHCYRLHKPLAKAPSSEQPMLW